MESLSKNKLTTEQINSLTQKAFGKSADSILENTIGEFSALYMITLADKEVVLKIAPKDNVRVLRYEKNAMQREVEALRLVRANTTVPVPEVLFYDTSKTLCDSEYFFAEKLHGDNFNSVMSDLSEEQKTSIVFQLGKLNRQINGIEHNKFGYLAHPNKHTDNWQDCFKGIITDLLSDSMDLNVKISVPYAEIESIIDEHIHACDNVKTPKLVHWDLWNGNVLVQSNEISGIIDFERSLYADTLMEHYFRKHAINADFNSGYGIDFTTLDKNAKIRLALYDLYIALIWQIEYYSRNYDEGQLSWREEHLVLACNAFENEF
jgi:fructosamine-3-kinase